MNYRADKADVKEGYKLGFDEVNPSSFHFDEVNPSSLHYDEVNPSSFYYDEVNKKPASFLTGFEDK